MKKKGYTLIEILMVVTIAAIIIASLVVYTSYYSKTAREKLLYTALLNIRAAQIEVEQKRDMREFYPLETKFIDYQRAVYAELKKNGISIPDESVSLITKADGTTELKKRNTFQDGNLGFLEYVYQWPNNGIRTLSTKGSTTCLFTNETFRTAGHVGILVLPNVPATYVPYMAEVSDPITSNDQTTKKIIKLIEEGKPYDNTSTQLNYTTNANDTDEQKNAKCVTASMAQPDGPTTTVLALYVYWSKSMGKHLNETEQSNSYVFQRQ